MSNRLIGEGTDVTFESLTEKLETGETLVATWLRDPANTPNARAVNDSGDLGSIVGKTTAGYYIKLRFFATDTNPPSENYFSYNN